LFLEIYGEYDVKLNETKDNSSGFISINTGCICHAEEMSVAWYYKVVSDILKQLKGNGGTTMFLLMTSVLLVPGSGLESD
jgi:hypothetical protein